MDKVLAVGATGGRPREPLYSGHRQKWRALFSRTMIGWKAVFAPRTGRPPVAPTGGSPCDSGQRGSLKAEEKCGVVLDVFVRRAFMSFSSMAPVVEVPSPIQRWCGTRSGSRLRPGLRSLTTGGFSGRYAHLNG